MNTPNTEHKWPHGHHLAVHTPVQAHRTVDGAPNDYPPAPAAQGFPQQTSTAFNNYPQELIRQLGYSSNIEVTSSPPVVTSNFGGTSPSALNNNNNNTKLDLTIPDKDVQVEKIQLTPVKHELVSEEDSVETLNNNRWEPVIQTEERSRSAADSRPKMNEVSNNVVAHHPLLSPRPIQSSRLSWLAETKPLSGIAQPLPLKPEECSPIDLNPQPRSEPTSSSADNSVESERQNLNEEETARLLLTLSQNFSVNENATETEANFAEVNVSEGDLSSLNGQRNNQRSRTFFRPPGHRGSSNTAPADGNGLICEICGFGCASRFHYNSHMNTHGCHTCVICNYRSRTEGRLKKHMQDSHTAEQRQQIARNQTESTNNIQPNETNQEVQMESESRSQRLPGSLEQIRVLADTSIGLGTDQQNGSSSMPAPVDTQAIRRSGGKPKRYTCKQCGEISTTKEAHWRHAKTHIPPEKQILCTECEFVTEYKHHYQYHLRNHYGSKPFKCSKCEYTCVNKSMLNSHMKSHNQVYQFRCQDCTYQTKYCHSLKMHTYKYGHNRVQGQVYTVGDENGESVGEGMETESMKNYDIPPDDIEAIERYRRERAQHNDVNQFQQPEPERTTAASQLSMISQQTVGTPRLSSLLLQPITGNPAANNQLQQFLLQQQRIGQVQQLIHNAANNFLPRHKCDICEFTSVSQEELLTHKINHFMYNQQQAQTNALNLYSQRLANNSIGLQQSNSLLDLAAQLRNHPLQQPQNLNPGHHQIAISKPELTLNSHDTKTDRRVHNETPDPSGATTTTTASTPRVGGENYAEDHTSGSSELHDEASSSPSDSHKSMDAASSSSPHSSSSAPHSGSKKRKARKLDEISQRLQDKCSPDNTDSQLSPNDKIETSNSNGGTSIVQPIPTLAPINGLTNGSSNSHQLSSIIAQFTANQDRRQSILSYTCQHCMISFSDQALYQIHLGYHGFDNPFKCNRCGKEQTTALNFNLHLYQEKH